MSPRSKQSRSTAATAASSSSAPRFPGRAIRIGDRELVIPVLSLGDLKRLKPKLEDLMRIGRDDVSMFQRVDDLIDLVLCAARRNYPELTADDLLNGIDLMTLSDAIAAVMGAPGRMDEQKTPSLAQA